MASRYVLQDANVLVKLDDDELEDFVISDHAASDEDIPLLFNELRLNYNTDSIEEIQQLPEETDAERDAQAAFEDAINRLNEANADRNKSCASCSREVRVENVSTFRRGQHISMPGKSFRKYFYKHHAIIKEIKRTAGTRVEMDVIHFYKDDDKHIKICKSSKFYDLKNDELYIVEYVHPRYTADEIVQRAESVLQENGDETREFRTYNPGTSNCEHFATWCVVGKGESFQVEKAESFLGIIKGLLRQLIGYGGRILERFLFRFCYVSSDEIAASLTKAISVPGVVLGAAYYLLYCIGKTLQHTNDYRKGQICWSCLKGKLQDLWLSFGVFGATSAVTFIFFTFALPLLAPGVGIPLVILLIFLSVALQWSVPKIRKALQSPFTVDKNEIEKLSDLDIGDVVSLKYYKLEHAVIVTEVHEDNDVKGRIRGVHYGLPGLFGTREIMEDYFEVDLSQSKLKLFDCSHLLTYAPETVVLRARKRVGETKWALASNRSDHFCFWAKVKQRPMGVCEDWDNGNLEASASKNLSSLFVEEKEVHDVNDMQLGDVIMYKTLGILTGKVNLDGERGRQFKIEMMIYDSRWYGRLKTYIIDLSKDRLFIKLYHPAHCHPMAVRVDRAKRMKDKKGTRWTDKGFIKDCIMLNP